jgi:hypothetical protein
VLTSLNQITGVDRTYADSSGTFIRLTLKPGTDPEKVISEARRVVEEQVEDRTAAPLYGNEAKQAMRQHWQYTGEAPAPSAGGETQVTDAQTGGYVGLVALLVALFLVLLGVLLWWRRDAWVWLRLRFATLGLMRRRKADEPFRSMGADC